MKGSDRDAIFTSLIKISELLLKECEALGEIVDCFDDAFIVAKRVISHNVEILEIMCELNFLCDERLLHNEPEVRALFSIIEAIKDCSDNIEDLSRGFVRYNVTSLRENSVSSILDLERAAKIVLGLDDIMTKEMKMRKFFELTLFFIVYAMIGWAYGVRSEE